MGPANSFHAYTVVLAFNHQKLHDVTVEDKNASITSYILSFHVINKSSVHNLVAAGCWIISSEIPVAKIIRTGLVKCFYALKNHLDGHVNVFWSDQFCYLA